MSLTTMLLVLAAFAIVCLVPADALAWGPVTHIVHGTTVLAKLGLLPEALGALLASHPGCYLYGCIGADIIQAKALAKSLLTHCHSWPVAWKLVESADGAREEAFAWGYMTHLAADVVSHNHFVPASLLRSYDAPALGHAYWEARVDALQGEEYRRGVRTVLEEDYRDCDALVERVIDRTLFSFKTNKRIFDSIMALSRLDQWQGFVRTIGHRSRYPLSDTTVEQYNAACVAAATDLLRHRHDSYTQGKDATGRELLQRSAALGRKLRMLERKGRLTEDIRQTVHERLDDTLFDLMPKRGDGERAPGSLGGKSSRRSRKRSLETTGKAEDGDNKQGLRTARARRVLDEVKRRRRRRRVPRPEPESSS